MGPPASRRIPRVLRYSGTGRSLLVFIYAAFTLFGPAFQRCSINNSLCFRRPATPESMLSGLGSSAFARRYSQNRCFFLFLRLLRCFSSPGVPPMAYGFSHRYMLCACGFPHSDICGSLCMCHSPQLFAAYHVFHRLSVPRHPPCALGAFLVLIFLSKIFWDIHRYSVTGHAPSCISRVYTLEIVFLLMSFRLVVRYSVSSFQGAMSDFVRLSRSCSSKPILSIAPIARSEWRW